MDRQYEPTEQNKSKKIQKKYMSTTNYLQIVKLKESSGMSVHNTDIHRPLAL